MGFNLLDPNEGRAEFVGRKPLQNTIRVGVGKTNVATVTISRDICNEYGLQAGDRVNVLLGTDEDRGTFCISPTALSDDKGYKLYKASPASVALSFSVKAKKLYGVSGRFECRIQKTKRTVLASIPLSAMPQESRTVQITNGEHLAA